MFKRRSDRELMELQQQLLAVEEEEEYEDESGELDLEELDDLLEEESEDLEEYFDSDYEEEYGQEPFYRNHANRYGLGNPKKFVDDGFFDEGFDDGDVLYRKDYKKARRKKRRQTLGLMILAVIEIGAIAAIILWWISWMQ